jgi:DNA-binding transcriptional LysR family regulator
MELRQLEYFVAVAEEANFTRAAERVHISQSGVSAQLKQLERELGAPLIDRSARTASLTPAGKAALEHARVALRAAQDLRRAVDEVTGLVRGELTVGMLKACMIAPFFDALAGFRRAHPGVGLSLVEDDADELIAAVRAGRADAALVAVAGECPADLESIEIVRERLVAAVPADHPLVLAAESGGDRSAVMLAELAEHPLICLPRGAGIRAAFDRSCAAVGLSATVALQAGAPTTVADLAARGLGVAVLSETTAAPHAGELRILHIADAETEAVLALVWPGAPNPALSELLGYCRRSCRLRPARR